MLTSRLRTTGQAIIQARNGGDGVCTDDAFVSNYENCLQCSGPDNVDIWRFYGNSLSRAGESCGLPTTPLSGEQPDVGPAIPAGGSSDDEEETSSTEAPAEPTPTSTADEEEQPAPTTTQDGGEQPAPTTTGESAPSETEGGEASPTAAPTTTGEQGSPSATSTEGGEYPVSPAPTASTTYGGGNGTVPSGTTAPPEVSSPPLLFNNPPSLTTLALVPSPPISIHKNTQHPKLP